MVEVSEKTKVITNIKKFINFKNLDGYIIPKNDGYFTEYSRINNLAKVTNFTGSAGFALILKKNNYLFVDGRYTLQAKRQSGKNFKIFEIPYTWPKNLNEIINYRIGFDPKLFTEKTLKKYFEDKNKLVPIEFIFKNKQEKKVNKLFQLSSLIAGQNSFSKIKKVRKYMNKNKINYLYVSASENVNWLLNIRGKDLPNSPLLNCRIIVPKIGKLFLFIDKKKINKSLKKNFKHLIICEENDFFNTLNNLKSGFFCIDSNFTK